MEERSRMACVGVFGVLYRLGLYLGCQVRALGWTGILGWPPGPQTVYFSNRFGPGHRPIVRTPKALLLWRPCSLLP